VDDIIKASKNSDPEPQPQSQFQTLCENNDKRAEKLCLITKNILADHDRRLLDATLTNAVSRDAANAAFNLLVSAKNCSSNVEIHKVKWADYPGSYIALGDCKEFRPRLWALFSQSDDLTIERLGSGDFISSSPSSDVQATARKYAITLMNGDISGFRDHFTDALKTRDSVETVATRLRSMVEATGRHLGNLTSQKDPYTDTVLVTFNNVQKDSVLELDLDPSLNIRNWYLRTTDEPRHIPQKFQDVQ
jgi:hypothetical protein